MADHGGRGQVAAIEWPSGRELWSVPNRGGHDVQPLPDGHVLYTLGPDKKVIEMDASHNPVWTYGPEEGLLHPISAQRLPNGNTLIGDAQIGKVIEVDKDRKVVWTYESADLGKMRMRNSRRIASGNTLIAVEAAGKIIEVNPAGEIVVDLRRRGRRKTPSVQRRSPGERQHSDHYDVTRRVGGSGPRRQDCAFRGGRKERYPDDLGVGLRRLSGWQHSAE